jgi:type VI secretion system protein ImpA
VSEAEPSGPDRTDESERSAISMTFDAVFSDANAVADVNWKDIVASIGSELAKSKDIWLPVYMMRAGAMSGKLEVIADGAEILAALVERFWDTVHPQIAEYELQGRISPCNSLADHKTFLLPLQRMVLVAHPRLGSYTGEQLERFAQKGDEEEGFGMFQAAMADLGTEEPAAIVAQLSGIKAALQRTDTIFGAHSSGDGPNLQKTYEVMDRITRFISPYAGNEEYTTEKAMEQPPSDGMPSAARMSGAIESRDDVLRAIDTINDYYRRKEPSSPVPVVLKRAKQWVNMDFLTILEDINPGSIEDVKRVLVFQQKEGDA